MSELSRFAASLDFPLDPFQVEACRAVEAGKGVLVAAPTGAGKTVVGEFAVALALARGQKAFYTTPIKALSNQKYADLVRRHGSANVGLLTGDSSINGDAPVVVMTTEVLRNMTYAGSSTLTGLAFVVMDEVHYLADRFRGAVWEEVIIHLMPSVQLISLSATVSNAEEFGDWLETVRGNHEVIVSEHRPVPLWQHMQVGQRMFDLFADSTAAPRLDGAIPRLNPHLTEAIRSAEERGYAAVAAQRGARGRGGDPDRRRRPGPAVSVASGGQATRTDIIRELDRQALLPAITFIFSRVGCEAAVGQLLGSGIRLITEEQGERNRRLVEEHAAGIADEDLGVLGYWDFVEGLSRGFAAHHAGMLPTFREIVEELFTQGAVRAVFATETLALGINMPARTVVLEKLVKFNGESHVDLSPAEYTQLTGRAGRRGIDIEGHALVLWRRGLDPVHVAGLASTRTFPLRSSFRPSYNMAVNLVAQVGRSRAAEVLQTSFAQFQADRSVVGMVREGTERQEAMDGYAEAMHCHLGDFREYAALRHRLSALEKDGAKARSAARRAEAAVSLESLRLGDIIRLTAGRRAGLAVVVEPSRTYRGATTLPSVLTEDRQVRRLALSDVTGPVVTLGSMPVPKHFNAKSPKSRRDLATTLRIKAPARPRETAAEAPVAAGGDDARIAELRRQIKAHPCHACPEREVHARWSDRWWRLKKETSGLQRQVEARTNTVARTFQRICGLLTEIGYLGPDGESLTADGERLRRLYSDRDLLAAECLRHGVWKQLDRSELAACVSMLIHEPRFDGAQVTPRQPTANVEDAGAAMLRIWSDLADREERAGLPATPAPDAGLAWSVHRWASGQRLEVVLKDQDLAAGDFVRRCKQIVDLLGQIANAADEPHLRRTAKSAVDAVLRGVVAADRLD
ncbi:MAG TPA: DEAD/DEAH box helicase [Tetrasphaera sp.]|uniref:DEAD/DEAH box helicase n=1 Tax=Nostocoides sp. TaxID=1917966 RepID=UPI002BB0BBDE|nr:DEAD/DEAH box helicase [Tetrasphaera sp.]HNQ06379.1 DEAD/DEAH box helicase [Tetrasphaera sp.]